MDMKRILQAMDGVATKPVAGVNDMSKFVSIVKQNDVSILNEGANPHKVSLPVQMAMQHYQKEEPTSKPVGRDNVIRKYFKEVEEELTAEKTEKRQLMNQYASVIAERVMMKESLDEACWDKYKQVGMKKKGRKMVPNCVPKESVVDERSVSQAQARTMAAAAHNPEFAKKVGISGKVAKEFNKADTGKKLSTLPKRVKKGNPVHEAEGTPEGVPHLTKELLQHIVQQVGTEGAHAIVKSLTWGDGAAKELLHLLVKDLKQDVAGMDENEIPGHSMGFTGGVGPGTLDNMIDEMPIDFNKDAPADSEIHSHQGVNPASINARIMRARGQLKELAAKAQSNELIAWESIANHFPELAMNIEQIRHGIAELAKVRKGGGRRVHNIPKEIGEAVMPAIKAATPTAPKTVKPKAKTSTCKAGQVQTGMQIKNGKSVPKCSVTTVKKKVAEAGPLGQVGKDAVAVGTSAAALSQLPFSLQDPVFPDFKYYTYWDLLSDLGLVSASYVAGAVATVPTLGASDAAAVAVAAPAVLRLAKVLGIALKGLRVILPDVPSIVKAISKLAKSLYRMSPAELAKFVKIASTEGFLAACVNIGINFGIEKLDKAIDDIPDYSEPGMSGKQAQRNRRDAVRKYDTAGNPSPALHPTQYPS